MLCPELTGEMDSSVGADGGGIGFASRSDPSSPSSSGMASRSGRHEAASLARVSGHVSFAKTSSTGQLTANADDQFQIFLEDQRVSPNEKVEHCLFRLRLVGPVELFDYRLDFLRQHEPEAVG